MSLAPPTPPVPLVMRTSPLSIALSCFGPIPLILLLTIGDRPVWGPAGAITFLAIFVPLALVFRLRQRLIADANGVSVTILRTVHIPWQQVLGFQPNRAFIGGTLVLTTEGKVRSVAPSTWWGGPPAPSNLAPLEQLRLTYTRAA